jgi:hypothetical protein
VVTRVTDAAELRLAGPARSEVPDEGREAGEMGGRNLGGSRQTLQAVRRKSPRHVTLEDLTDSSLLGTGEHGAAIVVDPPYVGQWPRILGLRLPPALALPVLRLLHLEPLQRLPADGGGSLGVPPCGLRSLVGGSSLYLR